MYVAVAFVLLLLPILYELYPAFRYYAKFGVYYVVVNVACVLLIPIFAIRPGNVRNTVIAAHLLSFVTHLVGIKWELRGEDLLAKDEAYVLLCNHQSSLDFLGMLFLWPTMGKCAAISKKELLYIPPFGPIAWLAGTVFIDRVKRDEAHSTMSKVGQLVKEKKMKLWVFPEGTRNSTPMMLPFKKGAFHVAIEAQIPILPVVFSSYNFLDAQQKTFDMGKVVVTTLPPIPTEGLTKDDIEALMTKSRDVMMEVFTKTSEETKPKALVAPEQPRAAPDCKQNNSH